MKETVTVRERKVRAGKEEHRIIRKERVRRQWPHRDAREREHHLFFTGKMKKGGKSSWALKRDEGGGEETRVLGPEAPSR